MHPSNSILNKLFSVLLISIVIINVFNPAPVLAQDDEVKREINTESGKVSFIGPAKGSVLPAERALDTSIRPQDPAMALAKQYAPEFGIQNPARDLSELKSITTDEERITTRYQQNYNGIPVIAGELIVNTNEDGDLYSISGEVSPNLALQTKPTVDSAQAKVNGLKAIAKWYKLSPNDFVATEPELWIFDESLLIPSNRPVELVWRLEVSSVDIGVPVRELVLVNATRGNISIHFNQVDTAWSGKNALGSGYDLSANPEFTNTPTPPASTETPEPPIDSSPEDSPTQDDVNPTLTPQTGKPDSLTEAQKSPPIPQLNVLFYVDVATGNNSNSCTSPASPCKDIQETINKAGSGDTIYITSGTYLLSSNLTPNVVINNGKNLTLSGGWDSAFTLQSGVSTVDGGNVNNGYLHTGGTVTLENFIIQNSRSGNSGAIYIVAGSLTIKRTTLKNNTATNNGAGIFVDNGTVTIINSTISGNTATSNGGGVYSSNNPGSSVVIRSSTIANNTASNGGGIYRTSGSVSLTNTILANNTGTTSDCSGTLYSASYSIIENVTGCAITSASNNLNVDPQISAALSGTFQVHTLQSGSPAINVGTNTNCPTTDQLGHSRPQGGTCDIGAVETGEKVMIISGGSNQLAEINTTFSQALSVFVQDEDFNPVSGVDVTFTAPASGVSGSFSATGTNTTTVTTDSNGIATASTFTANSNAGQYLVSVSANDYPPNQFQLTNLSGFWYVALTGSNSNSCYESTSPCQSILGVLNKTGFPAGGSIRIAAGESYSGATINESANISGGWSSDFTTQNGFTNIKSDINISPGITVNIQDINISYNNGFGGAIYNSGDLNLSRVTISNNTNWENGGAIYQNSGNLTLENVTISNNIVESLVSTGIILMGGGIYVNDGSVTIDNSTITQNTVIDSEEPSQGGGIANPNNRPITITNSIIAGNIAAIGDDCYGLLTSGGHNLIGVSDGCSFISQSSDIFIEEGAVLQLGNLQNNGGVTNTHALLTGSSALNAGSNFSCLATDQRGVTRPQGPNCDIGAYEGSDSQSVSGVIRTYVSAWYFPGYLRCDGSVVDCANSYSYDPHVVYAHTYAHGSFNFYNTHHNRYSIDNNNMPIISSVHYGNGYDNAFWNGDQMVYGDAYGFPLADDVVAHELTHGVTQYESNLFYYYQSGAINESFSDLWGEYYDQGNGQGTDSLGVKWLMGEDISGLGAIRSMSNPPAYGDPDKMTSTYYYEDSGDNGGVHYNSGVNNKAVYLMVDGGTFNGRTVTSLGWEKTAKIYYEAQTNLLSSGADYSDLYYALQQACTNLTGQYGITSGDCVEVKDALDAVEMNLQPATNFNPDAPLCTSPSLPFPADVYTEGFESGLGSWTITNGTYTRWQLDSPYGAYAHSGEHSLYGDDYPDVVTDARAQWSAKVIPAGAYLHFSHAYDFEFSGNTNWDGGVIEYSTNGGASWIDASPLIVNNGYTGAIYNGSGADNPLKGKNAFVKTSHGYISTRLNLSSLAGQSVSFRWRMGLDSAFFAWGWWVDDVRIYTCSAGPTISGNVGASGVTLSYVDGTLKTVTSQADGSYALPVSNNWSGTVTPTHACYIFDPVNRNYSNVTANQAAQNYSAELDPAAGCAEVDVTIGVDLKGIYPMAPETSQVVSYPVVGGPVVIESTNGTDIVASMVQLRRPGNSGGWTGITQVMGVQAELISDAYVLPRYNGGDATLYNSVQIANFDSINTNVSVTIAGVLRGTYAMTPGESLNLVYAGVVGGPVVIASDNGAKIIASLYELKRAGSTGLYTGQNQMMALPLAALSDTYVFPRYNDTLLDLDAALVFANVDNIATNVTVTIGGVLQGTYPMNPGTSQVVSYPVVGGPVVIASDNGADIVASMVQLRRPGNSGGWTGITQVMGVQAELISDAYVLPRYNGGDTSLYNSVQIANFDSINTNVTVTIAGVLRGTYAMIPGESLNLVYAGVVGGPIVVESDNGAKIIASLYELKRAGSTGLYTGQTQMMALPLAALSDTYVFPRYNDTLLDLDASLIFAVP